MYEGQKARAKKTYNSTLKYDKDVSSDVTT